MTMYVTTSRWGRYDFVNAWTVIYFISGIIKGAASLVMSKLADLPGGYSTSYLFFAGFSVLSIIFIVLTKTNFVGRSDKQLMEDAQKANIKAAANSARN